MDPARLILGTWPTPLEPVPRLAEAIGLRADDLWMKRDDLTGLGGGGNKVRKLEYACAQALAEGATALVTSGAAQSNHARLTAAAGARLGLPVHLVLTGSAAASKGGNLLLDEAFGAVVHWAGDVQPGDLAACASEVAAGLAAEGARPYVIPFGGSTPVTARGYVQCATELLDQAPDLVQVVVAVGSGGTMAGLVHGLGPRRVLGVHTGALADPASTVLDLLAGLRAADATAAVPGPLRIRLDQVGRGYSHRTPQCDAAMAIAAHSEGIVLDPVYTGRAHLITA